jgi:chloramphenicol 3-O-phosphotransferase
MHGIDLLLGTMTPSKFSMHGDQSREGRRADPIDSADPDGFTRMVFADFSWQSVLALHDMLAALSRRGLNVIADHLMFVDPPIIQDCIWALKDLPVVLIGLRPDREVLRDRIEQRSIALPPDYSETIGQEAAARIARNLGRLMPWYLDAIYQNEIFDLVLDTAVQPPDLICDSIAARLAQGPGTAFSELRKIYPRPANRCE